MLAFLDTGAPGEFIDRNFCHAHQIPIIPKISPLHLKMVDGSDPASGLITHQTSPVRVQIQSSEFWITFQVGSFPHHPIILGLPFLRQSQPKFLWEDNQIEIQGELIKFKRREDQLGPYALATLVTPAPSLLDPSYSNTMDLNSLPLEYREFADVFSPEEASILPIHRPYDCAIDLIDPKTPLPFRPIYRLSPKEDVAMKEYLDNMVSKGFIRPSKSPAGAPVFFVPESRWVGALISSQVLGLDIEEGEDWPLLIAHFLESGSWPEGMSDVILRRCKKEEPLFAIQGPEKRFVRKMEDGSFSTYLIASRREPVIWSYHNTLGHLAANSIVPKIKSRFWFPSMTSVIRQLVATCPTCQRHRGPASSLSPAPISPISPTSLPFERWGIDFVGPLPSSRAGNRYLITAIDYTTRWPIAVPVKDMSSPTVVSFLYNQILMQFGAPYELISDRAKNFLEGALPLYENMLRIHHLKTTSYHPQTNGMVERMHGPLKHALATLADDQPERWDEFVPQALFALRVRDHSTTGYSPFFLMYGVQPRLPIDPTPPRTIMAPLSELERKVESAEGVIRELEELGLARQSANVRSELQAELMLERNEEDAAPHAFEVGDWVKMKKPNRTSLEPRWIGPFMVVKLGHQGTYWLLTARGSWHPNPVNQARLALWKVGVNDPFMDAPNEDLETHSAHATSGGPVERIAPVQGPRNRQGDDESPGGKNSLL